MEPSPPQDQQANQEQNEGPPSTEQDQDQGQIIDDGGEPNDEQDHVIIQGQSQDDEQVLDGTLSTEDDPLEPSQEALRKREYAKLSRLHPS